MEIKKILNLKKISVAVLSLACVACSNNESYYVSIENVEEKPELPIREIVANDWCYGLRLESCNGREVVSSTLLINQDDTVSISGWALDIDKKIPVSSVYIDANGKFIKAKYGIERKGVQEAIGSTGSNGLGFEFSFDRNILKDNVGMPLDKITFYMVDAEKKSLLCPTSCNLIYTSEIPNLPESEEISTSFSLDYCNSGEIANGVITLDKSENIIFTGWSADVKTKQSVAKMYLKIGNNSFKVESNRIREDVRQALNLNTSEIGFEINLPRLVFTTADGSLAESIQFYMIDNDGKMSKPVTYQLKAKE